MRSSAVKGYYTKYTGYTIFSKHVTPNKRRISAKYIHFELNTWQIFDFLYIHIDQNASVKCPGQFLVVVESELWSSQVQHVGQVTLEGGPHHPCGRLLDAWCWHVVRSAGLGSVHGPMSLRIRLWLFRVVQHESDIQSEKPTSRQPRSQFKATHSSFLNHLSCGICLLYNMQHVQSTA
jgi:hypothetical protein